MKAIINLTIISLLVLCQACYFGAGLVEEDLTDNFSLFANNSLSEMSIRYYPGDHRSNLIVAETVFAVGYNDEFIIAKSHPMNNKDSTVYHLIDVKTCKTNPKVSAGLTLDQFQSKRIQLGVPRKLEFTIIYKELE